MQWFGLQTDSAARTFTGAVDGLTVTLRDEESGSVDFEAIPEPGAGLLCLPGLLALVRGRRK